MRGWNSHLNSTHPLVFSSLDFCLPLFFFSSLFFLSLPFLGLWFFRPQLGLWLVCLLPFGSMVGPSVAIQGGGHFRSSHFCSKPSLFTRGGRLWFLCLSIFGKTTHNASGDGCVDPIFLQGSGRRRQPTRQSTNTVKKQGDVGHWGRYVALQAFWDTIGPEVESVKSVERATHDKERILFGQAVERR